MKLKKQNDRVVYTGDVCEKLLWGYVQFPKLYAMRNGNIGLYIHDDDDSWVSLDPYICGKWLVTEDKGLTWRKAEKADIDMMGTVLPSGDVLRQRPNGPVSLKGVEPGPWVFGPYHIPTDNLVPEKSNDVHKLPARITTYGDALENFYGVYWLDTMPDGLVEKRFSFNRLKNGETENKITFSEVKWNYRTILDFKPGHTNRTDLEPLMLSESGLYACRDIKVAPDGSLYIAEYKPAGANPFTGVYEGKCNSYILRSVDNGESWEIQGYIPYQPDEEKDKLANLKAGFSEPCIDFMPDGSILCILRTCDVFHGAPEWGPTYLSRSYDGGKTWSKPEYFKDRGALPQLLQLKCGATLAVVTRPGIYVYASYDSGKTWTECVEVMTGDDRSKLMNKPPVRPDFHEWAGSCCNCTIQPLSDNKALLAYSDFYVPDENGVKRKGIKTREIVVE